LKAAGKVIQTGMVRRGRNIIYLLNFLIVGERFEVELVIILIKDTDAPRIGRMQYGSGLERSLNQRNPSLII